MTDELPPLEYLDAAANLAGWGDWDAVTEQVSARDSIIAHARTLERLAKYEPKPVDPAELQRRKDAREAGVAYFTQKGLVDAELEETRSGVEDHEVWVQSAYIALCLFRDKTTPIPVEQWGEGK